MSKIIEIRIEKIVNHALGLAHSADHKVVFVPYVLPGELVEAEIINEKKQYAYCKLLRVIEPSQDRVEPRCPHFYQCGGCDLQFASYKAQEDIKKNILEDMLQKNHYHIPVSFVPSPNQWQYRNTAVFHKQKNTAGFYVKQSHEIIPLSECPILETGLLDSPYISEQYNELKIRKDTEGHIVSSVSQSKNNVFKFNDLSYTVWIKNFFQINTGMVPLWLEKIKNYLQPEKEDVVLDLFSGVGLITLYAAQFVKKIYGIEVERSAVKRAIQNSQENHIRNAYFFSGSSEKFIQKASDADKIIVDPPRSGMNPETIEIINSRPLKNMIYVSCYPSTFFRDLKKLQLKLKKITLLDMFPQTSHFEIVALLEP